MRATSPQPSFFDSLFDVSFSRFVTLRLVEFLYVLASIVLVLVMFPVIVVGFTEAVSGVETVGYMVLAPVVALLYPLIARVWLELVVVVCRIGETATEVRDLLRTRTPPG